ncbi:MAG: phosphatidylglycerophosphatase A [Zetaproteobacteria bacterium]|nr:phosphatidylglycerophosphatase A [Zetaproteobacteria bacterium]
MKNEQRWLLALRWFVAGFGSGWLPKAPGTWGSLAALPMGSWIWLTWQWQGLLIAAVLLLGLGCAACVPVLKRMVEQDPGWIVVDEWVGQWVCMGLLAMYADFSWGLVAMSFIAFRLFDIWKPFPIRQLEHWGPSWWSIMFDDVVAGVMGAASVFLLGFLLIWFGL